MIDANFSARKTPQKILYKSGKFWLGAPPHLIYSRNLTGTQNFITSSRPFPPHGHFANMAYYGQQQAPPGIDQSFLWGVFQR